LIPAGLGLACFLSRALNDRDSLQANPERVNWAALVLVLAFLAAQLYVVTRCPVWNNVKYVIQAMPLCLLAAYWLTLYALPTVPARAAFFVGLALLFGASTVRTLDPLSLRFFGTTPVGPNPMLCMNSRLRTQHEPHCGNDEMVYNLQLFVPF
jgi:hypothetical protein